MSRRYRLKRALLRWTADVADTRFWVRRQVRALGMGLRRRLFGRRPTLLAHPATVDPDKPVVVAIPGLMSSWEFMWPLLEDLVQRGYQVAVVPQLGANLRSVAELTELVELFLESHRELWPVVFVTHSKGGLVGKRLLLDDPDVIRAVGAVTLSAPYGGANAAKVIRGLTHLGREVVTLQPGTRQQVELARMDAQDSRITALFPVYDEIVGIRSRVHGGRNRAVSSLGHNQLLGEARIHHLVAEEIDIMWQHWQTPTDASTTTPPTLA